MTAPTLVRARADRTPQHRHPVRAELRTPQTLWAALALAGTVLVPMVAKAELWQGSWSEWRSVLHATATLLGGPLAAAVGCWQGGRERRARMGELRASGARGSAAQFAVATLPVVCAVLAGYASALVGTLLANWPYATGGRPAVGPAVADAVFLAGAGVVGAVVGRLVHWRLAAPALAVCAYVALAVPTYTSAPGRFLVPAAGAGLTELPPVWWQPWALAGWTGGLATAVALGYALRRRRFLALLPLALAVTAAVPLVRTGEDMWRPDPAAARQVCDDSTPRVCVAASNTRLLPQISRTLAGVTTRLDGVPKVPVRFTDRPGGPRRDEVALPDLSVGQSVVRGELADPDRFVWETAAGLVAPDCPADVAGRTGDAVRDWLAANSLSRERRRATARRADGAADDRALRRLAAMPEAARRAWLGRYFAAVQDCGREGGTKVPKL